MTKYDIIYTKLDKRWGVMQAYHENEKSRLSENKIFFIKNTVSEPSAMARLHWHNSYELLYVRRGYGEQQINSEKIRFKPGDAVIIRPGDIHTTYATSEGGAEIDVLQFIGEYFGDKETELSSLKSSVIETPDDEVRRLFDRILGCIEGEKNGVRNVLPIVNTEAKPGGASDKTALSGGGSALLLNGAVFMLCGLLSGYCKGITPLTVRSEFAETVCQYVSVADDIRLETVSRYFGYSAEHFSRRFHAETGASYKYYCERIKMQKFLDLLGESEASVELIAEKVGYSDASSFTRAFKRIYGITPGAYKRLKR